MTAQLEVGPLVHGIRCMHPSQLRSTYCLTGDRNTELVIEAIAAVCMVGDRWRPVLTNEIDIALMGNPGDCPWSDEDALAKVTSLYASVYSDQGARERELSRALKIGSREALLSTLSAGSVLCKAVADGWAAWVRVGDSLGVELTSKALERIGERS